MALHLPAPDDRQGLLKALARAVRGWAALRDRAIDGARLREVLPLVGPDAQGRPRDRGAWYARVEIAGGEESIALGVEARHDSGGWSIEGLHEKDLLETALAALDADPPSRDSPVALYRDRRVGLQTLWVEEIDRHFLVRAPPGFLQGGWVDTATLLSTIDRLLAEDSA